jgi:nucleoside-diphosphate-sugar epimerase
MTILAGKKIDDGTPVNLGTMERIRVLDAVNMVSEFTGHKAEIKLLPKMPTGALSRVADNSPAKKLLGWEPKFPFREGLRRTIDWYYKTKDRSQVKATLDHMLTER